MSAMVEAAFVSDFERMGPVQQARLIISGVRAHMQGQPDAQVMQALSRSLAAGGFEASEQDLREVAEAISQRRLNEVTI